jgi:hypothetical protein
MPYLSICIYRVLGNIVMFPEKNSDEVRPMPLGHRDYSMCNTSAVSILASPPIS